jgi:hypothetical protein
MKYSQQIGIVAAIALIIVCFFSPWIYVPSINLTLDGMHGKISDELTFGKQAIPHSFYCIVMIICFAIPKVWAKRINIFASLFNLAWAIKNCIIFVMCRQGECPQIKFGMYAVVGLSIILLIAAFTPKMQIKAEE